jgi:HSP20 family protein
MMAKGSGKDREDRELAPRGPFSQPGRMQREMERMFEDFWGRSWPRPWFGGGLPRRGRPWEETTFRGPAIEIYEEKDDVIVKAELPGMKKVDLVLNISGNLLTIKGEKKEEEEIKEKGYYYSERSYGSFARTVEIPKEVQTDKANANFKDGVLEVRFPKTEETKRKDIKINVE